MNAIILDVSVIKRIPEFTKKLILPTIFSKKVLKLFPYAKKKLVIIKKGDHSLSDKNSLKRITTELKTIVSNMF